jgi:hypothetical protein
LSIISKGLDSPQGTGGFVRELLPETDVTRFQVYHVSHPEIFLLKEFGRGRIGWAL